MKRIVLALLAVLLALPSFASAGGDPVQLKDKVKAKVIKRIEIDRERQVVLDGPIFGAPADDVADQITALDLQEVKPIFLIIRSNGGSIASGLRIVMAMDSAQSPITCLVDTKAYSMAAIILAHCDTAYMQKFANMMHHEAQLGLEGSFSQVKESLEWLTKYLEITERDTLAAINTGRARRGVKPLTMDDYLQRLRKEWWLNAYEAAEQGLVDGVLLDLQYILPAKNDQFGAIFGQLQVADVCSGTSTCTIAK